MTGQMRCRFLSDQGFLRTLLPRFDHCRQDSVTDAALLQLDQSVDRSVKLASRTRDFRDDGRVGNTNLDQLDDVLISKNWPGPRRSRSERRRRDLFTPIPDRP